MDSVGQRSLVLGMLLLAASCDESVTCCDDPSSWGVVRGAVLDHNEVPQSEVLLRAINVRDDCDEASTSGPIVSQRTDEAGQFEMLIDLFLTSPGLYCVDMALSRNALADTVTDLEVRTFAEFPPPDTTKVVLVVTW